MGLVIKLATSLKKWSESDDLKETSAGSELLFSQAWTDFCENELAESTKKNTTTLGGASKFGPSLSDDDDAQQFDDNMESIMGRFNSFNSYMSGNDSKTEEDEEKDKDDDDDFAEMMVRSPDSPTHSKPAVATIEVELPKPEDERM